LGCVRVALLPPRSSRLPVVMVGTLAAVTAISALVVLGLVLPGVQAFGVSFIALVGILATVWVGRSRGPNLATPGLTVTAAMLAGVAGCIAIFAYIGMRYPAATHDPTRAFSVLFAIVLTAYVWLALAPPQQLTMSRLARRIGCGLAVVVFGLGYPVVSATSYDGQVYYLLVGLFVVIPGCAAVTAAIGGTRRHGAEAAVWMGLISGLFIFVAHTVVPIMGLQRDAALADDGYPPGMQPDLWLPTMLGRELGGGIFALMLLPGWALFFGLVGGTVGRDLRQGWRAAPRRSKD